VLGKCSSVKAQPQELHLADRRGRGAQHHGRYGGWGAGLQFCLPQELPGAHSFQPGVGRWPGAVLGKAATRRRLLIPNQISKNNLICALAFENFKKTKTKARLGVWVQVVEHLPCMARGWVQSQY
jgi:hypothetical protein